MKTRIPVLDILPFGTVEEESVFHCVFGIHEDMRYREDGSCWCEACGMGFHWAPDDTRAAEDSSKSPEGQEK